MYTPDLQFLPLSIRVLTGLLGLSLYFIDIVGNAFKTGQDTFFNKNILSFWLCLFLSILYCYGSYFYNLSTDLPYITSLFIRFAILFGSAYFIVRLIRISKIEFNIYHILNTIITVTFIQCVIALLLFVSPEVKSVFDSIQKTARNPLLLALMTKDIGSYRILGFGTEFFGAAIESSFSLISIIAIVRSQHELKGMKIIRYGFTFLFIAFVGILMSRTTFIGILISLIFLHLPNQKNIARSKFLRFIYLILLLMVFSIPYIISNAKYQRTFTFAFEAFINYKDAGTLSTQSSDALKESYYWPQSVKTYIIGDGYMSDPAHPEYYYMATDVGFLRLIYFGGIGYLLIWFSGTIAICKVVYNKIGKESWFFLYSIVLVTYLLIVNLKGLADFYNQLLLVFMVAVTSSAKLDLIIEEKSA